MKIKTAYQEENIYRERREIKTKRQRLIFVFCSTFAVVFFTCLSIASMLTPAIDVPALQKEEELTEMDSSDFKGRVDPRLRLFDMQEGGTPLSPDDKVSLNEEITQLANKTAAIINPNEAIYENQEQNQNLFNEINLSSSNNNQEQQAVNPENAPKPPPIPKTSQFKKEEVAVLPNIPEKEVELRNKVSEAPRRFAMIKVLVGAYDSPSEARKASCRLNTSNLPITPFIKEVNGVYTLQVGSFSSVAKANKLAEELRAQNLPVRLIQE